MKTLLLSLTLAVLAGCASPQGQKITPAQVGRIAKFAAAASAIELLDKKPEAREDLVKAQVILKTLVAGDEWDITQLALAFQKAGFKVLNGAKGILIVEGAVLAADLSGHSVDLKNQEYAKAAIIGALEGLNSAL